MTKKEYGNKVLALLAMLALSMWISVKAFVVVVVWLVFIFCDKTKID